MKLGVLVGVLLLFSVSGVKADMVARDAMGNYAALHKESCVAAPWLKDWKTATVKYEGKMFAACWKMQDGTILVLDSAGDVTPIPVSAFTNETGV